MKRIEKIGEFETHPIGIGTATMGGSFLPNFSAPYVEIGGEEQYISAIRYSITCGQNHIDTAFSYGLGHCEEIVGEAISGLDRKSLFIASKIWKSHLKRKSITRGAEDTLKRLGTDHLDLLYVHSYWEHETLENQIGGLNDAIDRGLTKLIGVSNYNLEQLVRAMDISTHPIAAIQILYNVLNRSTATMELLNYCRKNRIAVVAHTPLGQKLLTDQCANETILEIAKKHSKTPAQIALNWLLLQNGVVAILKAVNPNHIDENLTALKFDLPDEDIKILDKLGEYTAFS